MMIAKIETFALRIPFKKGIKSDASAWGDRNSPATAAKVAEVAFSRRTGEYGRLFT